MEPWKFLTVTLDMGVLPIIRGCQSVSLNRMPDTIPPPFNKKKRKLQALSKEQKEKQIIVLDNQYYVCLIMRFKFQWRVYLKKCQCFPRSNAQT